MTSGPTCPSCRLHKNEQPMPGGRAEAAPRNGTTFLGAADPAGGGSLTIGSDWPTKPSTAPPPPWARGDHGLLVHLLERPTASLGLYIGRTVVLGGILG
jgi:hypothetical protein